MRAPRDSNEFDVAIVGAGFAGLLAASALRKDGRRVVLIGRAYERSPQAVHCHQLAPEAWDALVALIPPIEEAMKRAGMRFLPPKAFGFDRAPSGRLRLPDVSREMLDRVLGECVEEAGGFARRPRMNDLRREDNLWHVQTADGEVVRADWLIDASGAARSTGQAVAEAGGEAIGLEEADADFSCQTWLFEGAALPPSRGMLRGTLNKGSVGALCAQHAPGLTALTLHGGGDPPLAEADPLALSSDDPSWREVFREARIADGPYAWRTRRISRLVMAKGVAGALHWLALGDSLVTTPPVLGWGLSQAVEQAARLSESGLGDEAADAMGRMSASRFKQAMVASLFRRDAFSAGGLGF